MSLSLLFVGCGREDSSEVGSMRTPSMQVTAFLAHMDDWVRAYPTDTINAEEFQNEIYRAWPDADLGITNQFMADGTVRHEEFKSLEYHYFKGGKCEMQDSTGNFVKVNITGSNGFVVRVLRTQEPEELEDLWVSLACRNGMRRIQRESDVHVTARIKFFVSNRKSLSHYLKNDYWSIDIAELFGLYLYHGKKFHDEFKISADSARTLVPFTDSIQISIKVKSGMGFRQTESSWEIFVPQDSRWYSVAEFRTRYVEKFEPLAGTRTD